MEPTPEPFKVYVHDMFRIWTMKPFMLLIWAHATYWLMFTFFSASLPIYVHMYLKYITIGKVGFIL